VKPNTPEIAMLWPLAALLLTPLILLGGLVALIGMVGIGCIRGVRTEAPKSKRAHLASVVRLENPAVDVSLRHAA
jgi:hypothetical protein